MNADRIEHLERLARLRDSGALSPEEYELEKQRILNTGSGSAPLTEAPLPSRARSKWAAVAGVAAVGLLAAAATLSFSAFREGEAEPANETRPSLTSASSNEVAAAPAMTMDAGPSSTPAAPRAGPPDLARYAGKYPGDPVEGVTFLSHPELRRLVHAAAPADIAKRVLDDDATSGPVYVNSEYILYWACEPHNCGAHNWTVRIDRQTRIPEVCYYREEEGTAYWHHEGRIDVADTCPQDLGG